MIEHFILVSILTRVSIRINDDKPVTLYLTAADVNAVGFLQLDFLQKSVLLRKLGEQ